jgi:hypothetical protein
VISSIDTDLSSSHPRRRVNLLAISLSSLTLAALACQQRLHLLQVLGWREVAASVGHVVLEPVSLLVALIAIGLRAAEGFRKEERGSGAQ